MGAKLTTATPINCSVIWRATTLYTTMQTCGNKSLSLRFSSDFLVSTMDVVLIKKVWERIGGSRVG